MSDNYHNCSDSSRPQAKKTVDESRLNTLRAKKTVVEPHPHQSQRTPLTRKDPLEGKTIGDNDRYLLQTLLGQGGMSKVYQALDTKFEDRVVAIKLMTNYSAASGKHLIKRFMAEIKAISRLKHPNIIQILDFGVTPELAPFSSSPFYVMEYFEGKTLQTVLTEKKTIPLDSLSNIIRQVCAGLKEAHRKGIVHRDLKPDNIFLIAGGAFGEIVKIIDFGIAKNISADDQKYTQLTREGSFIGTYHYASPEQCRGSANIDQRSDIYSLGVILYEAICGQNPYNLDNKFSPSQADWIACHIRVPPKPLKQQPGCEQLEEELANIVMKCLVKSPQDRLAELGELQNAFANRFSVTMGVKDDLEIDIKVELRETKIEPEPKQPTPEVASNRPKKLSLVAPTESIAPSTKLELNSTPIWGYFHQYRLLIGAAIASMLVSIIAGYGYMTHRKLYSQAKGVVEQIENLKRAKKYQECVRQAEIFRPDYSDLHAEVNSLLAQCQQARAAEQLTAAKKLGKQHQWKEALALASQIPLDAAMRPEAEQLIAQWSAQIFQLASNKYQEGNLQEAIAMAEIIPDSSSWADKVKVAIQEWDKEWQQNKTHLQTAQEALDKGKWQEAIEAAKKVSNTAYWQQQSEPIIQKAEKEIALAKKTPAPKSFSRSRRTYTRSRRARSIPRRKSVPSPSSKARSTPQRKPIPSTAPFPLPRSRRASPRSTSTETSAGSTSTSTEWTCLNNPHPRCRK